jgi:hypothetical protein
MREGLRCRFARIPGETPKGVLDSSLTLPAVLGNVEVTEEAQHSEYDTVSAGQFSEPAQGGSVARMLRTIELEGLTLEWDAAWLVKSGQDPDKVRGTLLAILRSKKGVEILLTMPGEPTASPELRMFCTFRSVRRTMRQQENDTRYYNIAIKEWRRKAASRV